MKPVRGRSLDSVLIQHGLQRRLERRAILAERLLSTATAGTHRPTLALVPARPHRRSFGTTSTPKRCGFLPATACARGRHLQDDGGRRLRQFP